MSKDSHVLFIGDVSVALWFRKLIDTNARITWYKATLVTPAVYTRH
ncbi:Uncharacterised protein [Klebsiella pneumoniae subsp. pneumoniae]|uniref:Uncharacterized protein n=1 Tax=Klebsiella pneumoniae subsp. pneumoniae TaxID=72407 RepID=A0A377ZE80_KLEPN|nr:Uncharacterised protein [Klebsiella pneumoniae subsp. pneumoniae]